MGAPKILGIIGGIFGILSAVFALMMGGLGGAFGASGMGLVVGLGFAALLISIVGLVGGAISDEHQKVGGMMMVACGIGGFIAISAFYIIAGPLLIIGGIIALVNNSKNKKLTKKQLTQLKRENPEVVLKRHRSKLWLFGIFYVLAGVSAFSNYKASLMGVAFLILAVVLLPPTHGLIKRLLKFDIPFGVRAAAAAVGLVLIFVLSQISR